MQARVIALAATATCAVSLTATSAPAQPTAQKNIVQTAVAAGQSTTLVKLVKAAGLAGTLSKPGPYTVFAPKKTPEHVTRILRDTIRPFMQDKAVVERLMKGGSQVSYMDGPEFARFLEGDTDRLVKIVRQIGLS